MSLLKFFCLDNRSLIERLKIVERKVIPTFQRQRVMLELELKRYIDITILFQFQFSCHSSMISAIVGLAISLKDSFWHCLFFLLYFLLVCKYGLAEHPTLFYFCQFKPVLLFYLSCPMRTVLFSFTDYPLLFCMNRI